jgi:hypothetical protein
VVRRNLNTYPDTRHTFLMAGEPDHCTWLSSLERTTCSQIMTVCGLNVPLHEMCRVGVSHTDSMRFQRRVLWLPGGYPSQAAALDHALSAMDAAGLDR